MSRDFQPTIGQSEKTYTLLIEEVDEKHFTTYKLQTYQEIANRSQQFTLVERKEGTTPHVHTAVCSTRSLCSLQPKSGPKWNSSIFHICRLWLTGCIHGLPFFACSHHSSHRRSPTHHHRDVIRYLVISSRAILAITPPICSPKMKPKRVNVFNKMKHAGFFTRIMDCIDGEEPCMRKCCWQTCKQLKFIVLLNT